MHYDKTQPSYYHRSVRHSQVSGAIIAYKYIRLQRFDFNRAGVIQCKVKVSKMIEVVKLKL